jgi:hypothetical protein
MRLEEMRNAHTVLAGKREGTERFEELSLNGEII